MPAFHCSISQSIAASRQRILQDMVIGSSRDKGEYEEAKVIVELDRLGRIHSAGFAIGYEVTGAQGLNVNTRPLHSCV